MCRYAPLLAVALASCAIWVCGADVTLPTLNRRVTDQTSTLSGSQLERLEQHLAAFESRKGTQLAVLIVPTTVPESIEQFGIRVVDQWKLGRKGVDDGALLIVAKNDRTLRIEVGRGLEGILPDAIASRIINEIIVPAFKNGDFGGGIEAGVQRMMAVIEGETLPPAVHGQVAMRGPLDSLSNKLPFLLFAVPIVGAILRAILGRLGAGAVGAAVAGGVAWLAGAPWVLILIVVVFVALIIMGGGTSHQRGGLGGWSSGGGFGGGSGGGGGGFSGGGGSFGGGGASGRW